MAIGSVGGYIAHIVNWSVANNAPASSLSLPSTQNSGQTTKKISFVTGGNIARGANEFASFFNTITAGGSLTINLQSLTDILGFTGIVLLRVKGYRLWLLSVADDATNGTVASSVTIGNAGANPFPFELGAGSQTRTLQNGDSISYETGSAAGLAVSAGALNVKIQNNDGGNAACVLFDIFGATT